MDNHYFDAFMKRRFSRRVIKKGIFGKLNNTELSKKLQNNKKKNLMTTSRSIKINYIELNKLLNMIYNFMT